MAISALALAHIRRMLAKMASSEFVDQDWRGLYAVGGIMGILNGVLGLASSRMAYRLYSAGYPDAPAAYLQLVSQKQVLANSLWSLWILNDLLGFVSTVAIYLVLRRSNRTLALLGALFVFFYMFYDISVTELNSLTLVSLSQAYANAPTDAVRASYVAAAAYGYAALPLQTVLSFGVGAIGWLLWSVAVLQGRSNLPKVDRGPRRHRQRHRNYRGGCSGCPHIVHSWPFPVLRRPAHRNLGDNSCGPTVSV